MIQSILVEGIVFGPQTEQDRETTPAPNEDPLCRREMLSGDDGQEYRVNLQGNNIHVMHSRW